MPKMIQLRNVPDKLHKQLKARAATRGKTLSGFLVEMVEREMAQPDYEELLRRVQARPIDDSDFDAATYIRRERDSR